MRSEIQRAVAILREGGLVAFPTETVYGLGADARNERAVAGIFAAKGRPAGHPLIVHLPSAGHLDRWARVVPDPARALAARFWPGPLTIILEKQPDVPDAVTGGQPTVGLRVPSHPLALELLGAFDGGLAAPSANRFGSVSPTTAAHVLGELGGRVDLVLDGGPCEVGVESTIVDLSVPSEPRLLRPGGIAHDELEAVLGPIQVGGGQVRAPGTLASHYAPHAEVRAVDAGLLASEAARAAGEGRRVVVLAARDVPGVARIALPDEPEARARRLYAALREVDAAGYELAVVALSPEDGLGAALSDRLRRASAPRPGPEGT